MTIDPVLKQVLQEFSRSYQAKRSAVLQGYDFEALRTELAKAKDDALARAPELLAVFEKNARGHGTTVLRAKDSREANSLILEICRDYGVTKMVKGKSMVSEEAGLNRFLARHGIAARETDLGEWIVQLGAEAPTHMVMPAIHMTRRDVAALFSRKLGRPVPDDILALVRIARGEMRREIFAAQAGLTGANALIAESGAVLLVTNEGNGRLVATVPPVHIVLASVEKVVPSLREAILLLKLLPRNATGQSITSYVSFIAGPHALAQVVILLDNHRTEMAADPVFREALRCIKCSACLNVCPVYQVIGGAQFAHVYMGGIGALFTAWVHGLEKSKDLVRLCLRCHRCESYCATKIPIADMIAELANRMTRTYGAALWKRLAFDGVLGTPFLQKAAFGAARTARRVIARPDGYSRRLPAWMKKYDKFRALPAPAARPLSRRFAREFAPAAGAVPSTEGSVTVFAGCLVEYFYPEVGLAAARVLSKLGYGVSLAPAMCCGFPMANAGFQRASAKAFYALLRRFEVDGPVVTLCPTCTTMLASRGPAFVTNEKSRRLAAAVVPFSRFVLDRGKPLLDRWLGASPGRGRITYHDSCHHKHLLKASQEARDLVRLALRTEIAEMDEPDACCGFAGSFTAENPEISAALLADKLSAIERTGADEVALDCPGCLLQIRGGCRRMGLRVRVSHTAEILDRALGQIRI
jgi:L-lactate dehydrogenase complex protein LldF